MATIAADHIRAAIRILDDRMRRDTQTDEAFDATNAHALVAVADALTSLAQSATEDPPITQTPWPDGVTARILTRVGMRSRDFINATVDITNADDRSTATCRPCGWTRDHGLTYRDKVLEMAREHASDCTALPNPTT